tara:strand:+ start:824 stop:1465 length:642 start_codon:yes stop_codon:yes gene_type:complete
MTKTKHILFLNKVDSNTLSTADCIVSCEPLIKTAPLPIKSHTWNKSIPWVVTSRTAAHLITNKELPEKVYAIGNKTAQLLPQAICPEETTAKALAELIIEREEKELLFICGEQRREELPQLLKSVNIKLTEAIVYRTEILQKKLNLQSVDGLAFMSPSSVIGMAKNGGFNKLPCFAIGTTTAHKLTEHGQTPIISTEPSAESIVQTAQAYFNR